MGDGWREKEEIRKGKKSGISSFSIILNLRVELLNSIVETSLTGVALQFSVSFQVLQGNFGSPRATCLLGWG